MSADDRAYTCALLHDIGRLGLFVVYPREYAKLLSGTAADVGILERERGTFGVDHCEAGPGRSGHCFHRPPNTGSTPTRTC